MKRFPNGTAYADVSETNLHIGSSTLILLGTRTVCDEFIKKQMMTNASSIISTEQQAQIILPFQNKLITDPTNTHTQYDVDIWQINHVCEIQLLPDALGITRISNTTAIKNRIERIMIVICLTIKDNIRQIHGQACKWLTCASSIEELLYSTLHGLNTTSLNDTNNNNTETKIESTIHIPTCICVLDSHTFRMQNSEWRDEDIILKFEYVQDCFQQLSSTHHNNTSLFFPPLHSSSSVFILYLLCIFYNGTNVLDYIRTSSDCDDNKDYLFIPSELQTTTTTDDIDIAHSSSAFHDKPWDSIFGAMPSIVRIETNNESVVISDEQSFYAELEKTISLESLDLTNSSILLNTAAERKNVSNVVARKRVRKDKGEVKKKSSISAFFRGLDLD